MKSFWKNWNFISSKVTNGAGCGLIIFFQYEAVLQTEWSSICVYCGVSYRLKTHHVAMYADDITMYYSPPSVDNINPAINAYLEALRCWLRGQQIGCRKQVAGANFTGIDLSSSPKLDLNSDNEEITMLNNTTYLGQQADDQLKLSIQLSSTFKKVSRCIGMLKYSKRYLPKENLMMLYLSPILVLLPFLGIFRCISPQ